MNIRKKDQSGSTLVMVAVFIIALFGLAALAIDVGNVYTHRNRIQDAIDSGALAGVVSWAHGKTPDVVNTAARAFATTNSVQDTDIQTVECGEWISATHTFVGPLRSLPSPFPAGAMPAVRVT